MARRGDTRRGKIKRRIAKREKSRRGKAGTRHADLTKNGGQGDDATEEDKSSVADTAHVGDAYKNTRFVISPRGNVTIMCCRTFEAITCGAVPVIANCSKEEVERTYNFGDRPIPFIYARTWEDAVDLCRSIQNLDEIQQQCIDWYRSIHESIRTEIQHAICA